MIADQIEKIALSLRGIGFQMEKEVDLLMKLAKELEAMTREKNAEVETDKPSRPVQEVWSAPSVRAKRPRGAKKPKQEGDRSVSGSEDVPRACPGCKGVCRLWIDDEEGKTYRCQNCGSVIYCDRSGEEIHHVVSDVRPLAKDKL